VIWFFVAPSDPITSVLSPKEERRRWNDGQCLLRPLASLGERARVRGYDV